MIVPGHANMTRDAVLLTATAAQEKNAEKESELATRHGGMIDPSAFVERRIQTLAELVLGDDERAVWELLYQEKIGTMLDEALAEMERLYASRVLTTGVPGIAPPPAPSALQHK